jgi:hypothetical protein
VSALPCLVLPGCFPFHCRWLCLHLVLVVQLRVVVL